MEPNPKWRADGIVHTMRSTFEQVHGLDGINMLVVSTSKHSQTVLYKILAAQVGDSKIKECLLSRLASSSGCN